MSDLLQPPQALEVRALDTVIISANPVLAVGIQYLLDDWSDRLTCHRLDPSNGALLHLTFEPNIMILAPQNWQDLAEWLPALRRHFGSAPWLLFTEPRIAGLFLSLLDPQPCTLIPDTAAPEQLRSAALALGAGRGGHLTSELMSLLAHGTSPDVNGSPFRRPSSIEMQCGCAVSLGLGNRQIASVLHLSEATVKSHLYRLSQKLGLGRRQEVGATIHRALSAGGGRVPSR
jgi:DNA-binding NarL/FixJ family response regulator